jgi:hypothetical protein
MGDRYKIKKDDLRALFATVEMVMENHYHEYYKKLGREQGANNNFICWNLEAHGNGTDIHPSVSIDNKSGKWHCFACGIKGNFQSYWKEYIKGGPAGDSYSDWIIDFLGLASSGNVRFSTSTTDPDYEKNMEQMRELHKNLQDRQKKATKNRNTISDESKKIIPMITLDGYVNALLADQESLIYLYNTRRITTDIINIYRIGMNENGMFIFPMIDSNGDLINLKAYDPRKKSKFKWSFPFKDHKTCPTPMCNFTYQKLYFFAGEPDTYCAISFGIEGAVTMGSEAAWDVDKVLGKDRAIQLFSGKEILICLDSDETGVKFALKLADALYPYAKQIKIINLDKSDINEFGLNPKLVKNMPAEGKSKVKRIEKDFTEYMEKNHFGELALKRFKALEDATPVYIKPAEQKTSSGSKSFKEDDAPFIKIYEVGEKDERTVEYFISYRLIMSFLYDCGYSKYYQPSANESVFIHCCDHIVHIVSIEQIVDYFINYIRSFPEILYQSPAGRVTRDDILVNFYAKPSAYFSESKFDLLLVCQLIIHTDTPDTSYFYYINGFVSVTKVNIKLHKYSDLKDYIWQSQIKQREYTPISPDDSTPSEFELFLQRATSESAAIERKGGVTTEEMKRADEERFKATCTCIGYLLHRYQNPASPIMPILNDARLGDDPNEENGGTGKGLTQNATSYMRSTLIIDGKLFDPGKREFAFSQVELGTEIIILDDLRNDFDIKVLFSALTSGIEVERKKQHRFKIPPERSPKLAVSCNHTIHVEGGSAQRRTAEYEYFDYYDKDYTPLQDFGHKLFYDWSPEEWARFDHFMLLCTQVYLQNGLVKPKLKNLLLRKLISETCLEFVEFADIHIDTILKAFKKEDEFPQKQGESASSILNLKKDDLLVRIASLTFLKNESPASLENPKIAENMRSANKTMRFLDQKELFENFCKDPRNQYWKKSVDQNKFSQRSFTRWVNLYLKYKGIEVENTNIRLKPNGGTKRVLKILKCNQNSESVNQL